MTKRAGRGQAPSEGVGDRAPQGGTSAAATTKVQQQPLERLPGEQPAQSPVVPGGQYGDHTEGLRSVLLRVRRVPPPRRAALKAPGGETPARPAASSRR